MYCTQCAQEGDASTYKHDDAVLPNSQQQEEQGEETEKARKADADEDGGISPMQVCVCVAQKLHVLA